jgi:hypothetical protein
MNVFQAIAACIIFEGLLGLAIVQLFRVLG